MLLNWHYLIILLFFFPFFFDLFFLISMIIKIERLRLSQSHLLLLFFLFLFINCLVVEINKLLRESSEFLFVLLLLFVFVFDVLIAFSIYFLKFQSHLPLLFSRLFFFHFIQPIRLIDNCFIFSKIGLTIILFVLKLLSKHISNILLIF